MATAAAKKTGEKHPPQTAPRNEDEVLVLRELYKDHRNIEKTLSAYEDQLNCYRNGHATDLKLMYEVMSYLALNPDQYHHPLEDTFFMLIAKKDISFKDEVDKTAHEHVLIKHAGEEVLENLADQMREPNDIQQSRIISRSEQYIELLRAHMDREESLLFRPGAKLLSSREWRTLADTLRKNPDDPLFEEADTEHYLTLREYLQERVEEGLEHLVEDEYLQLINWVEGVGVFSSTASDISKIINRHGKQAWQETRSSYKDWINGKKPFISGLVSTQLECSLNGFRHYADSMNEIADALYQARDSMKNPASKERRKKTKK